MGSKDNRKRGYRKGALACLLLAVLLLTTGTALAKYTTELRRQAEMIAADFHISSDYLEEEKVGATYDVSDWSQGIAILLYNYEKENEALVAGEQIKYTVMLSDTTNFKCTPTTGTLGAGSTKKTVRLKIEPNVAAVPKDVTSLTVTVKTTEPFIKELKATFNLTGTHKPTLTVTPVTNNGNYYLATIRTGQYAGPITVTWDSALVPDNANEIMRDWTGASGTITNATAFTTYELIFFNPTGADLESSITISPVSK